MILVSVRGGLGNQMFQYACGRAIAQKLNASLKLDLDFYFKNTDNKDLTERGFELNRFNIQTEPAPENEIKRFVPVNLHPNKYHYIFYKIKRLITKKHLFLEKTPLVFDPFINQVSEETYLSGYWQSELYFKDVSLLIRQELSLKVELSPKAKQILSQIEGCNAVSLHIRRGDFLNQKNIKIHGILSADYYMQAVDIIFSKLTDPYFFIFTDDIAWVNNNFHLQAAHIIVNRETSDKGYEDLWLMSKCKHHIVANSSFSWWGAWLDSNEKKIVIAPKSWIVNMPANANIIPKDWISL
jgi:hypothetical protein